MEISAALFNHVARDCQWLQWCWCGHNVINIVIRIRREGILRTLAHLYKEMDKDRFNVIGGTMVSTLRHLIITTGSLIKDGV